MEIKNPKIAIIGAGNMGGAIALGLSKSEMNINIAVSDVSNEALTRLQQAAPSIRVFKSNLETIENADIILLAVKPWLIKTIAEEIESRINYKEQIIISIASGVNFSDLIGFFSSKAAIFRVIPNTAIEILQSVSTIATYNTNQEQENLVVNMFKQLGKTFLVNETQLNAYMSLASCGIAYAFRYIRAAMEGAVELGIYPNDAKSVVIQTLRGAIDLLEANNSHPEAEIDKVTTPGGNTIKGLNEMEANGFSNSVIKGLKASYINKKAD